MPRNLFRNVTENMTQIVVYSLLDITTGVNVVYKTGLSALCCLPYKP